MARKTATGAGLLLLAIAAYGALSLTALSVELAAARTELELVRSAVADEKAALSQKAAFSEALARDSLGMVKSGENIFYYIRP